MATQSVALKIVEQASSRWGGLLKGVTLGH